jgi:hypothetical protein
MKARHLPACNLHAPGDELCHWPRPQAVQVPQPAPREPLRVLLADIAGALLLAAAIAAYYIGIAK